LAATAAETPWPYSITLMPENGPEEAAVLVLSSVVFIGAGI
jgi:hypothetical protein